MYCHCLFKNCCRAAAILMVLAIASRVHGQSTSDQTADQSGDRSKPQTPACSVTPKMYQPHIVLKNRPYSGMRITTCEKMQADGTLYKASIRVREWRDTEGRTRTERRSELPTEKPLYNVTVVDPVAHEEWDWSVGIPTLNLATFVRYNPHIDSVEPEINRRALPNGDVEPPIIARMLNPDTPKFKQVILKPQLVNGVYSEGDMTYSVADPGEMNNKSNHQEIVSYEFWIAIDLEMEVRHVTIDPELGKTTEDLVNIDQAEPNPKLFRPPRGYKIVDVTRTTQPQQPGRLLVLPAKENGSTPQ